MTPIECLLIDIASLARDLRCPYESNRFVGILEQV